MPVNAVAPNPATPPAPETAPPGAGTGALSNGGEDFDALLGDALANPTAAPTVTLAGMVAALAGQEIDPAAIRPDLSPGAAGGVTAAAQPAGASGSRPSLANAGAGAAVLAAGEQYLGVPYKWGGTSPTTGFDCSGFVQRAFADIGVSLPRVSIDQSRQGTEVAGGLAAAQPGDLLFWRGSNGRPNHIAIYAGDGQMLEAPSSGKNVHYRDVWRTPDSVRRVL